MCHANVSRIRVLFLVKDAAIGINRLFELAGAKQRIGLRQRGWRGNLRGPD
jgi:hypothetical protein